MAIWMYLLERREVNPPFVVGFMVIGTFFTIPIWLMLVFGVKCIFREFENDFVRRKYTFLLVVVLGGLVMYLLFWLERATDVLRALRFTVPYMLTLTISVLFYDIEPGIIKIDEDEN
jgi:hypothetical protein